MELRVALTYLVYIVSILPIGFYMSLCAMNGDKNSTKLLALYPAPSIATSWMAQALGCTDTRERVHVQEIKRAHRKHDDVKVKVLEYVYAGYFQPPRLSCRRTGSSRIKRGKKLLQDVVRAQRNDLAILLLAHLAPLAISNDSIRYALNSAEPCKLIKLLQNHGIDIDAVNDEKNTLLSCYALAGDTKKVEILLSCGADINQGCSVLPALYGTKRGNTMIPFLLAHGAAIDREEADVEIDYSNRAIQKTVFHKAVEEDDDIALRFFLRNALFEPANSELRARQQRILATLCLF